MLPPLNIVAQIRTILAVDVEDDGLSFDPDSIRTERITEAADYEATPGSARFGYKSILASATLCTQT